MLFWIKQENGCNTIRLEDDSWSHPIYVAADDKSDIKSIPKEEGEIFLANQRLWIYIKVWKNHRWYKQWSYKTKIIIFYKAFTPASKIETPVGKRSLDNFDYIL